MNTPASWFEEHVADAPALPFSFTYGGVPFRDVAQRWERRAFSTQGDGAAMTGGITLHTLVWRDLDTRLEVTCRATVYAEWPAVEWVLTLRNGGEADTRIVENLQALDTTFARQGEREFVLHHNRGSAASTWDFAPLQDILSGFVNLRLSSVGGRSSNGGGVSRRDGAFPFFDIAFDDGGVICAVGWSGQWAAQFQRDAGKGLNVQAGMELTHFALHPGEQVRSPRMLLFFYEGDRDMASNRFRRFMLRHHTPQVDGKPVTMPIAANTWFMHDYGNGTSEENQVAAIREFAAQDIGLDAYWLDAGWYGTSNWAADVGTWFPKAKLFPRGLRPVGKEAHKHGMGFVLWFEPERVQPGTWLYEQHPDWLITLDEATARRSEPWVGAVDALLDLGNPEAREWLTDFLSDMIEQVGITVYRQDFNFDPLDWWRNADAPDRQGITEIHHIEGLYALWDELLSRHPGLMIDNCASGGRRIDLETASRSVPLWRTDYCFESEGQQGMTLGLSRYIPLSAAGANSTEAYAFRSALSAGASLCWNVGAPGWDPAQARQRAAEFKRLRPLYYGDFYPLTAHSTASDVWCAYQLDRPDLGEGAIVAFRRQLSPYRVAQFKLRGLDPAAVYELTDLDSGATKRLSGQELATAGLEVHMDAAPSSLILMYRRA